MAIPYPASYQQGSYAVLVHQGLFGFAANSEASLLTAMNTLKLKNGIIKENTKTKLIQNELKAAFNVDNPKKIDKQALINLMETKLGITLSAADEAALLSQKQVTIVSQILARADVVNKFIGPIDSFLQDAAVDPTNFQTDLNNAAPTDILPNDASIAEDAPGGSLITTLTAVDPDAGDTFTFKLLSDASGKFDVLSDGQVRLKPGAELDFETATSHQITVEVKDQWGGTYQEVITINVTDVDPEPGNVINLTPTNDIVDEFSTPSTTVNNDVIRGSVTLTQFAVGSPHQISDTSTATNGDFVDGREGYDYLRISIGGSVFDAPTDIVIQGIGSENVEELVVTNSLQTFTDNVIIDMTQHRDVKNVQLPFSNTDLMLRDMQGGMVGGDITVQDPHGGRSFQFDFDASFLNGDEDKLTVHVKEMNGGGIEITENAESTGLIFGSGDPADLEQLYVSFEGEPSTLDYLTSAGTSEFYFSGPADFLLGNGVDGIDTFIPGTGGDSFFDDFGNNAATLVDASALEGNFYINLAGEDDGDFEFIGSQGDDLTIIGNSLRSGGGETNTFDGQGGHNTAILFGASSVPAGDSIPLDDNVNGSADNPLVNYQTVAFSEFVAGTIDARYFGQQVEEIIFMDGIFEPGGPILGSDPLTIINTDALPDDVVFRFANETQVGFPTDNNAGGFANPRNNTMTFLTSVGAPAVGVTVHFDETGGGAGSEDVTFAGPNVGVMNVAGTGGRADVDVTFEANMDELTTLNLGGNNHFQLFSNGAGDAKLAKLATIDGTNNTGGIDMQDAVLPAVTDSASHKIDSDIVSSVLGQTIKGGSGMDILVGSAGGDVMDGNGNDDTMFGNAGIDTMHGNAGNDQMQGGDGDDIMYGDDGDDTMVGGDGGDAVGGGANNDKVYGWAGNDELDGGTGNDLVKGGAGSDTVGGGLGVDEHWGDYSGQLDEPTTGTAAPQTSTVTIDPADVDVGDVYTVVVTGYGGQPDKVVSVTATVAGDATAVATALVTALETAPNALPAANVSSVGGVITIVGPDLTDTFTVSATQTNVPGIATISFTDGADIADVVTVSIDGAAPQAIIIPSDKVTGTDLATYVASQITLPTGIVMSQAGGVLTFTKPLGGMVLPTVALDDTGGAIFSINVGGAGAAAFNDGEQISIKVDGTTYTAGGGIGQTAVQALESLAAQIIAAEVTQGESAANMKAVVITNAVGDYTLQIIDVNATDAATWGDALADTITNEQVFGGNGGSIGTPSVTFDAGVADTAPTAALVQAGTVLELDGGVTVANGLPVEGTDPNTGTFSDTFVIATNDSAINIAVLTSASDDGAPGLGDDAVLTNADALASMDRIMDWNAGGSPDKLNFSFLNEAGNIVNYDEDDGATSLIDAVAAINAMLDGTVKFAAVEVHLAAAITENQTATHAGSNLALGADTYHTVVGADTNGDGSADSLVILVGVGSGSSGVDGFSLTDIVAVPV